MNHIMDTKWIFNRNILCLLLLHALCFFACYLVFVWFVYCGIFLDRIDCAECNVCDREDVLSSTIKRQVALLIITSQYFLMHVVYFGRMHV